MVVHQPHMRPGPAPRPHSLDAEPMCQKRMMVCLIQLLCPHALARREISVAIAVADEAGDLVHGEPVLDAVSQAFDHFPGIAAEGIDRVSGEPATPVFERLRQVPVKERNPGGDLRASRASINRE